MWCLFAKILHSNQYCVVIRGRVHMRIRMRLLTYSIRVPVCAYRAQLRPPLWSPFALFLERCSLWAELIEVSCSFTRAEHDAACLKTDVCDGDTSARGPAV